MGLFAQVGGTGTTTIWRVSFVAIAVVGLITTLRRCRTAGGRRRRPAPPGIAVVLYALVTVVGVVPEIGGQFGLRPSRSRRSC